MAVEPKMNFGSMPDESTGNIQPGVHDMVILTAAKELSKAGKVMLVLQVAPKEAQNLKIYDRYTVFNAKYEPESFGQYKLKKLLQAVDYIPKGNFTVETLAGVLPGMEFSVRLDHEEGLDGKKYLGIKDVESYGPVGQGQPVDSKDVSPQDFMEKEEQKEPSEKIKAELEQDDDIV